MMNRNAKWVGVALASLIGSMAVAGAKVSSPVSVSAGNASGSLGTARNSADATQYIGCSITVSVGSAPSVSCFAQDLTSYGSCSSSDANLVDAARAINGDSYIHFSWNTSGQCTYLHVTNASHGAPKQP